MLLSVVSRQLCRHELHALKSVAEFISGSSWRHLPCAVSVSADAVRFAGHSHWQNIKSTKEAKDAEKQKVAQNITRRIRVAVREGGSTNPKTNSVLARVLEEGKAKSVSNLTMTDLLKRLEKSKDVKGSQQFVEARGVGHCTLIVEAYTDRPKWTRQQVQHIMKLYGGSIGESGTAMHSFHHKGVVYSPVVEEQPLSKDEVLEAAIEAGAEEVHDSFDDHDQPAYQFVCEPKELHTVKRALEEKGLRCSAARLEYLPHTFVQLDATGLGVASAMLDDLENLDEVVRVYDNIDPSGAEQTST